MNQFDLVASPMRTAFVKGTPPADNFLPWTHVPNQVPLNQGVTASEADAKGSPKVKALRAGLAPEEGADLRRQTDQARLRRPGHRQPSELVHVHRVYAALSWREDGSPRQANSTTRHPPRRRRRRLKHVPTNRPLPDAGERVFYLRFKEQGSHTSGGCKTVVRHFSSEIHIQFNSPTLRARNVSPSPSRGVLFEVLGKLIRQQQNSANGNGSNAFTHRAEERQVMKPRKHSRDLLRMNLTSLVRDLPRRIPRRETKQITCLAGIILCLVCSSAAQVDRAGLEWHGHRLLGPRIAAGPCHRRAECHRAAPRNHFL